MKITKDSTEDVVDCYSGENNKKYIMGIGKGGTLLYYPDRLKDTLILEIWFYREASSGGTTFRWIGWGYPGVGDGAD